MSSSSNSIGRPGHTTPVQLSILPARPLTWESPMMIVSASLVEESDRGVGSLVSRLELSILGDTDGATRSFCGDSLDAGLGGRHFLLEVRYIVLRFPLALT